MVEEEKKKVVHADPTKDFFIRMITRDIKLQDCIFDLLDNCLDGANRQIGHLKAAPPEGERYKGYWAEISLTSNQFLIRDNCGGIALSDAIDYAFHFGRKPDAPIDATESIGLYGIGMKRALFKIGKTITVESSTAQEAFSVHIDVAEWAKKEDWDFDYDDLPRKDIAGTQVTISNLNEGVGEEFALETFKNGLIRGIARDYSVFLQKGFSVDVGGTKVPPYVFELRDGEYFEPIRMKYIDDSGVEVEIFAGLAGSPPDDISPEIKLEKVDYWGWFVLCNDRVVLAANKNEHSVWGDGEFQVWHPQYNGFMGIVSFRSPDPNKLPWTTTKRDVDLTSHLYRRAVAQMKKATSAYLEYTQQRRIDIDNAKRMENATPRKPLSQIPLRDLMKLPKFAAGPKTKLVTISYQRSPEKVARVKYALGNTALSNKAVGEETFDYYYKNEAEG